MRIASLIRTPPPARAGLKQRGHVGAYEPMVVVNGVFDLLHPGHLELLRKARSYPHSYVLVLINSDRSVQERKGPGRPIISELDRALMLWSSRWVDRVEIFDTEEELAQMIKDFDPDVMVKGAHYENTVIVG